MLYAKGLSLKLCFKSHHYYFLAPIGFIMSIAHFSQFASSIQQYSIEELTQSEHLKIGQSETLSSYYTPFDFIQSQAQIVIVGICPGRAQWVNALTACKDAMQQHQDEHTILKIAKQSGAFSGPIRKNLVNILDHIGLAEKLNIASTQQLFEEDSHLVHMTSVLKQTIFSDGKNYAGSSPNMLKNAFLKQHINDYFIPEIQVLPNALYIPMGKSVIEVLNYISSLGYLKPSQILTGFPHPSGANAERIQYFLGLKTKESLSSKTNADKIDQAKTQLIEQLKTIQF